MSWQRDRDVVDSQLGHYDASQFSQIQAVTLVCKVIE